MGASKYYIRVCTLANEFSTADMSSHSSYKYCWLNTKEFIVSVVSQY